MWLDIDFIKGHIKFSVLPYVYDYMRLSTRSVAFLLSSVIKLNSFKLTDTCEASSSNGGASLLNLGMCVHMSLCLQICIFKYACVYIHICRYTYTQLSFCFDEFY